MSIRDEEPRDRAAIAAVVRAAFADHPHSEQTEAYIVDGLRAAGALAVSLVAEEAGAIVGHAAFSPVAIADGIPGWYGLGPVAVAPDRQGRGIGAALIRAGLDHLRAIGAAGCVVLGEPAYYGRFGFVARPGLTYEDVPPAWFQALSFSGAWPTGAVTYHPAFAARGP